MFRRHYEKRSTNIFFVIFRLILSMFMLAVLVVGTYAAFKHFSGLDPLKLDPAALISVGGKQFPIPENVSKLLTGKIPQSFLGILSSAKGTSNQINKTVPGQQNSKETPGEQPAKTVSSNVAFRFLLVADSHIDNANLGRAIDQAKKNYPDIKFIIGLGDYSEVGTIPELKNAKTVFDNADIRYFLIPGDHDLWDCRNRSLIPTACFKEVFGPPYQTFTFNNFEFVLLDNSDNYLGFDSTQLKWLADQLEKARSEKIAGIFVFMHEPLYHPSSDHVMGWVEKSLKTQSSELIFKLKEAGVREVFAGDIHYFSEYNEPKTNLAMVTVGAITADKNPQTPRFAIVSIFDGGSTKVEDVEIK